MDNNDEGIDRRSFLKGAAAAAQAPAGSAENGRQAFMKFQCYTCHGTVGQGGDIDFPR